ncbi:HEAT repeat domain-containing protein [Candidatus Uabimicrobium amorphum]|uniref:HEAT repeat-containing PBS lyase n=1 Tax=Uabimicrobium amorphum TaxID=2596890 RepID=A0A5S9IMP0_UABAM|nr:HEAT repeat domain-containing protein [Candidatus Uabimicrobium amorphum]BBM84689.1 HEAT repeat-containing PBS lyase [Candidatus Uabimicrobium amorphum]
MFNKHFIIFLILGVSLCAQDNTVDQLIEKLSQGSKQQKYLAINELGNMGADAAKAIPQLIETLRGSDYLLKVMAAETLGKIGEKAVEPLVALFRLQDQETREHAVDATQRVGDAAFAIVVKHKADDSFHVRVCVATTLAVVGKNAAVLPELLSMLKDEHLEVKKAVIKAMGKRKSSVVLPQLIAQLSDENKQVQLCTIQSIGEIGENAKEAIAHLIPFLGEVETLDTTGISLMQIGDAAVTHLQKALRHEKPQIRGGAAQAIGRFGTKAHVALSDLVAVLHDEKPFVRISAAIGIKRIKTGVKEAVPALAKNLADEERTVRQSSMEALAAIGKEAKGALPAVTQNLGKRRIDFRMQTLQILKTLGKDAIDSIPALVESLNSAPTYDREIVDVLDAIDPQWREKYKNQVPIVFTEGISLEISCSQSSPNRIAVTITVTNLGSSDLTNILLNAQVTEKDTAIISAQDNTEISGNVAIWKLDSLAGEQTKKYHMTISYKGKYNCAANVSTKQGVKDTAECRNLPFDDF